MTKLRMLLFVLALTGLAASSALAQCPDLIEADCGGGSAWFGLRHDGANVAQGHTLTLPCDGAPLSAEFHFMVNGNPNGGVPSMIAGDEIHVVLMDADDNHIMMATSTVPADIYDGWISFEFPPDMTVPAGLYKLAAYTTVERQCSFAFCPDQDVYDGGNRIVSIGGIDGPWGGFSDHDAPFRFFIDSNGVPVEVTNLSSLKGQFR